MSNKESVKKSEDSFSLNIFNCFALMLKNLDGIEECVSYFEISYSRKF